MNLFDILQVIILDTSEVLQKKDFLDISAATLCSLLRQKALSCTKKDLLSACERWTHRNRSKLDESDAFLEVKSLMANLQVPTEPNIDRFFVYGDSNVTSPLCKLRVGEKMDSDTINTIFAQANLHFSDGPELESESEEDSDTESMEAEVEDCEIYGIEVPNTVTATRRTEAKQV